MKFFSLKILLSLLLFSASEQTLAEDSERFDAPQFRHVSEAEFSNALPQKDNHIILMSELRMAACGSAQIEVANASVEVARAESEITRAELWPRVTFDINYLRAERGTKYRGFGSEAHEEGVSSSSELSISYPIFDGGVLQARINSQDAKAHAEYLARLLVVRDVILKAIDLHFKAHETSELMKVASSNTSLAKELLEIAQRRHRLGVGAAVDLDLATTRLRQAELQRVQAANEFLAARTELDAFIGRNSVSEVCRSFAQRPSDPVPYQFPSLEEAVRGIRESSPSIMVLEKRVQAAQYAVKAAQRSHFPTVKLIISGSRDENSKQSGIFGQRTNGMYVGAMASYPLFTGFATTKQVEVAVATLAKQRAELDQGNIQELTDLDLAYRDIARYEEELIAARQFRIANLSSYDGVKGRFKTGVGNVSNVLLSQIDFIAALRHEAVAMSRLDRARMRLAAMLKGEELLR